MRPLPILFLSILGIIFCGDMVDAQTSISPTRVMVSPRERTRDVTVSNPNPYALDVTASFGYSLTRSDSNGMVALDTNILSPGEAAKSCEAWLKVSPRRFILGPNSSKIVRVLVAAPSGIDDGEYWGRLVFASLPLVVPEPIDTATETVTTAITLILATDIPVVFRKGNVATGIEFNVAGVRVEHSRARVLVDTRRVGNSAYRGTLFAVIRSADGAEVARLEEQFTTEFTLRKALEFPLPGDGSYTMKLESRSVRTGSASEAAIPAPTVTREYTMSVSGRDVVLSGGE